MYDEYRIGCSGYYYSSWKNKFYPKGLQPKNWLQYYSSVFNSVELNGTFYKTPKLSDVKRYANATPANFKFSVKMSRYITHIHRLKDSKLLIEEFQNLILDGLNNKLLFFLFQLPPSFYYNEDNLERIINNISHSPHNVIEFRHISWWNEDVREKLKNANLTFCNVDFPGLNTYFIDTTPLFYLRLHGTPVLFKSSYTKNQLEDFYKKFPANNEQYAIYFNNTYYGAAYSNALQLKETIETE